MDNDTTNLFDHLLEYQQTDEFKTDAKIERERFNQAKRESGRAASAKYRAEHPALIALRARAEKWKPFLLKHQKNICFLCGEPIHDKAEIDHLIPAINGGMNNFHNLHAVHQHCNRIKSTK